MLTEMTLDECMAFIAGTEGREFTVRFVKRGTGGLRVMRCRTRAPENVVVSGVGMAYKPAERGLLLVWDVDVEDWRMVSTEGITAVCILGDWVKVLKDKPETT